MFVLFTIYTISPLSYHSMSYFSLTSILHSTWMITPTSKPVVQHDQMYCSSWPIYKLVALNHTLRHHTGSVNAIAINPDGNRLISGGRVNPLICLFSFSWLSGDDGHIVVWNAVTGERSKLFPACFVVLLGQLFGLLKGLGYHWWQYPHINAPNHQYVVAPWPLTTTEWLGFFFLQSTYRYFAQAVVHNGPVLDIKFNLAPHHTCQTFIDALPSTGHVLWHASVISRNSDPNYNIFRSSEPELWVIFLLCLRTIFMPTEYYYAYVLSRPHVYLLT